MIAKTAAIIGGVGGFILAVALFQLVNTLWLIPDAHNEGREMERADALKKSIELMQKRSKTNAEIRVLDTGALCRELGGRWLPENNVCE